MKPRMGLGEDFCTSLLSGSQTTLNLAGYLQSLICFLLCPLQAVSSTAANVVILKYEILLFLCSEPSSCLPFSLRVKASPYLVPQSTVWLYDLALLFFLSSHCCSCVLCSPPWILLASLACVPTVSSAGDCTVNPSTSFKIFP